jgi:hypothetical protein
MGFDRLRVIENGHNRLSPQAKIRSKILFSNTKNIASFEAYGFLTMVSLQFTEIIMKLTNNILLPRRQHFTKGFKVEKKRNFDLNLTNSELIHNYKHGKMRIVMKSIEDDHPPSPYRQSISSTHVTIGTQVRHQKLSKTFENSLDDNYINCLIHYVNEIRKNDDRNCTILIATDRISTIARLTKISYELGCIPKLVEKVMPEKLLKKGEHGPWGESIISMADFYLISQSEYFLGTKVSSYSTLMLNVVAARAAMMGTKNPFAWGISIRHANNTLANLGLSCCSEYQNTAVLSYSKNIDVCKNVDKKGDISCIKRYPTQFP